VISEGQRLQYLEAMGIQAWSSRERVRARDEREADSLDPPEFLNTATVSPTSGRQRDWTSTLPASFAIGPGGGSILLLCNRPEDTAAQLASDVARCLNEPPVWGWLSQGQSGSGAAETGLSLERAIDERLFTRVLLFCADSTAAEVGKDEVLGSARIIYAPPIAELARNPEAKRRLWMQLLTHGWCSRQG